MEVDLKIAVSRFGAAAKAKLTNPAVSGEPEDQLRGPLERFFDELKPALAGDLALVGETKLAELKTRPDYAVTLSKALIGFIEVKAPGKGVDPRKFADKHDREQWEKLKALPNLLYTDGNGFSLWRDGKRVGEPALFSEDVRTAGAALAPDGRLEGLLLDFLSWEPIAPKTPRQLAETSARLCRLLRDEVTEQLARKAKSLTSLKADWRKLLFPEADDAKFADGYAQAVTFGLLMAKARGLSLADGVDDAAKALRKTNTLIGTALRLLTDEAEEDEALKTSLATLTRVLDVVDWSAISKDKPEAWLYFYEEFLDIYDRPLRKQTGSYYTPPEVVTAMVRLTDEALRSPERFGLEDGLASSEVTTVDPAVGTGTFLLGVLNRVARTVRETEGGGAVADRIKSTLARLIGFELQFGPFAVAQLRLSAEIAALTGGSADAALRLHVADTLADPDEEVADVVTATRPITDSRREANRIRREEAVTVVIGNPPYKEKAKGRGGWVEAGRGGLAKSDEEKQQNVAPLSAWLPPSVRGESEHAKHLRNLYVYFWRWAAWKVFGGRPDLETRDGEDARERRGVVCFITVAGFLNGPGFREMRAGLRADCDEIWVIDCTPEGHQPPVSSRVFEGVQQPVCIVLASRSGPRSQARDGPAQVRYRVLPEGSRSKKFDALAAARLDGEGWVDAPSGRGDPFLPELAASWASHPALDALFEYNGSGVMPGRTWVIAPDSKSLDDRWADLVGTADADQKARKFVPHEGGDRAAGKRFKEGLPGTTGKLPKLRPHRTLAADKEVVEHDKPPPKPVGLERYGFRSFDRQWIIADIRVLNRHNPALWREYSAEQVYATALMAHSPDDGPALTFTGLIPDLHHYKGSFGGRVFPLWADAAATKPNVSAAAMKRVAEAIGGPVRAEDLFAYLAAIAAHPAYTARFAADLRRPGLRIPVTADAALFAEAVALGREVVWLHTFGERFADGRGAPAVKDGPAVADDKPLSTEAEPMPREIGYDAPNRTLKVGQGRITGVEPEVWAYQVSGKDVIKQWFSYRRLDRSKPPMGDRRPPSPLSAIQPEAWPAEYTSELLRLLRVLTLLVRLEPRQADLLARIVDGPTIDWRPT